jgi:hypothetical protein
MEEKKNETATFNDGWLWHTIIFRLCKELNYIPEQIYELVLTSCLDWMSFFKERDEYEQKLADQQKGVTRY